LRPSRRSIESSDHMDARVDAALTLGADALGAFLAGGGVEAGGPAVCRAGQ
jgi:hypothetical protein